MFIIGLDNEGYDPNLASSVEIKPIIVGDYKYESQVTGKEGFDSHYCVHCNLHRTQWQKDVECPIVSEWTLESIKEQHAVNISNQAKGAESKGVCGDLYFNIPVIDILPPVFNIKLREVMQAVTYLNEFADSKVQRVSVWCKPGWLILWYP